MNHFYMCSKINQKFKKKINLEFQKKYNIECKSGFKE